MDELLAMEKEAGGVELMRLPESMPLSLKVAEKLPPG